MANKGMVDFDQHRGVHNMRLPINPLSGYIDPSLPMMLAMAVVGAIGRPE